MKGDIYMKKLKCVILLSLILLFGQFREPVLASVLSPSSYTVTDSHGNRYNVYGYSNISGKTASAQTGFSVQYYYLGTESAKATVNAYSKTITLSSSVSLSGGGANTLSNTGTYKTASKAISKSKTFIYSINSVTTTHTFTCEGAAKTFTTYN